MNVVFGASGMERSYIESGMKMVSKVLFEIQMMSTWKFQMFIWNRKAKIFILNDSVEATE